MALGTGLANSVVAQEAWLLLNRSGHFAVSRLSDNVLENIDDVGDLVSYGQSQRYMAFISRNTSLNRSVLKIVNKSTHQVRFTWSIGARVLPHMASPMEDLVLNDEYVYFVTMRPGADNVNSAGGKLDFNQLRLADGTVKTFALPRECTTSHLIDFNGIALIYAWNGFDIWKFDASADALTQLVKVAYIKDIVAAEQAASQSRRANAPGPGPFSDGVIIPGAGAFRLSKQGVLQKVLDANLNPVGPGRASVALDFDLGASGEFAQLFSAIFKGAPAIGVLGMRNGNKVFEYLSASSLRTEWTTTLAANVGTEGLVPAPPDAIAYVDHDKGLIEKTSPAGTATLWKLSQIGPSADLSYVQILSFQPKSPI